MRIENGMTQKIFVDGINCLAIFPHVTDVLTIVDTDQWQKPVSVSVSVSSVSGPGRGVSLTLHWPQYLASLPTSRVKC